MLAVFMRAELLIVQSFRAGFAHDGWADVAPVALRSAGLRSVCLTQLVSTGDLRFDCQDALDLRYSKAIGLRKSASRVRRSPEP